MDLLACFILLLLTLISYISLKLFLQPRKPKNNHNLPPGSTGWPIIGESLHFVSSCKAGKPVIFFKERMKRYSPNVFKTSIAGSEMAVLCGAGGNKTIFSNEKTVIGVWWPSTITNILIAKGSSMGDDGKMRDFLAQFLKPEVLKHYVPIMDNMIKEFMDKELYNSTDKKIQAYPTFKKLSFSVSCKLFLNIEDPVLVDKLSADFAMVTDGLLAVPIDFPGTTYNKAIKAANRIREEVYPIIKQRRIDQQMMKSSCSNNKHDLLSFLVGASTYYDEDIDEEILLKEIADTILSLLVASHDTTSSAMAFVIYYLADNPHVYNQVLEEQNEIKKWKKEEELLNWDDLNKLKYSRCVLNEVIRLAPPCPGGFRQATNEFTYDGFTIPKGWKLLWSVHSTHKDPKYFENPEEFKPSRFEGKGPTPYSFVPFGAGPRMCPGYEYARVEMLIFMHNMVTRFRWEKLVKNEKIISCPIAIYSPTVASRLMIIKLNIFFQFRVTLILFPRTNKLNLAYTHLHSFV